MLDLLRPQWFRTIKKTNLITIATRFLLFELISRHKKFSHVRNILTYIFTPSAPQHLISHSLDPHLLSPSEHHRKRTTNPQHLRCLNPLIRPLPPSPAYLGPPRDKDNPTQPPTLKPRESPRRTCNHVPTQNPREDNQLSYSSFISRLG